MTSLLPTAARAARLVLAASVAALVLVASTSGAAASGTDDAIRWSVTPADESGPDGRVAAEHSLDPGEGVEDRFAVRNLSAEAVTFELDAADGFYTRTGRFDMLPDGEESVDSGTWISLPDSVTVEAGETEVVDYSIQVPERAEPGDRAAGITASVLSVQSAEDGTSVGVDSRVGFRVLTTVTGEITPAADVQVVDTDYDTSWNVLRPGEVTVSLDVVNEGNTRLLAAGAVEAGGGTAQFPAAGDSQQELLPGDTRSLVAQVDQVWPLLYVPVEVRLEPDVLTVDGSAPPMDPVVVRTHVWAVPWPQLALLLGVVLLVTAVVWDRRRSRRRLEALLADAREQGRRSVDEGVDVR